MLEKFHPAVEAIIGRVIQLSQRSAWTVIVCSLSAAVLTGYYVTSHIAINTDTAQMLSEKLPWRATYTDYKRDFPYFSDNIVIVIDGVTPDLARDAATQLGDALRADDQIISDVFYPTGDEFLRHNQLLYLATDELARLVDELSEAQPFLARISRERSSASLFGLLDDALDASLDGEDVTLAPAMQRIAMAIDELNDGNTIPMSWQALIMGGADTTPSRREIIVAQPVLDFSALLPAEPAIRLIRRLSVDLELDRQHGIAVRLTGGAALAYDEMRSVITGSRNAGTLALAMVVICLLIGLRSPSLVAATLIALVVGLIFTAGFAVSCVGTLNMISIAFAVLYVGLGVDFAIHICLRYREMLSQHEPDSAVNSASRHVGVSLILCALTTSIGFFAFIPTAYRGVAELGLIAGVGMFISLAVSLILLPALLHVLPVPKAPRRAAMLPDKIASFPRRHARGVLAGASFVWIIAALNIPFARFDHDPINLNDPNAESVTTYRDLLNDVVRSPLAIAVTVDSRAQSIKFIEALGNVPEVDSVRSIDSFVPDSQPEKLAMIDDLALILGPDLELKARSAPSDATTLAAIDVLLNKLRTVIQRGHEHDLFSAAQALQRALERYRSDLEMVALNSRSQVLERLADKLLTSFDGRLAQLHDGLSPRSVTRATLPDNIRRRWRSASGRHRLEVYPATTLTGPGEMQRFVTAVRAVVGDAVTGVPVINLGASDAVILAFIQAFSFAFIGIIALLWGILRSAKEVAIVMAPLILAGLITSSATVIFSLPFNFANIIALPLLLGIGVDSALHILHRYKTAPPASGNLLQTSTARAVFFSALTTVVSFGNLAASTHAGTASMGVLLTIGVAATLVCTLLVLPAMLNQFMAHQP